MKRLLAALMVLASAALVSAQNPVSVVSIPTVTVTDGSGPLTVDGTVTVTDGAGPLNVICDSGCSGGTTDTDDGAVDGGQVTGLSLGLTQVWNGTNWQRMVAAALADNTANPTVASFGSFLHIWDVGGSNWDRWTGAVTQSGTWNVGTLTSITNAVTVTDGAGALNVIIDSGTTAVTNGGTFVVQENGAALTALQLIDDVVYTDDTSTHSTGASKVSLIGAVATPTDAAVNANDIGAVAMTTDRKLHVSVQDALPAGTANIGDVDVASIAAGDNDIGNVDLEFAGTAAATNNGSASAQTLRVTVADDSTGEIRIADDAGNQIPSGTSQPATNARGLSVRVVHDDPCETKLATPLPISLTANTQLIAASGSTHVYICSLDLIVGAATNVALVSGTGSVCATGIAGVAGGSTAATGWNFSANGGIVKGNGSRTVYRTVDAGDALCLLVSAANQVSGSITYVQQ